MIRVFVVDDHALVRTGFRLILGQAADIEVVGEAASGEEALVQLRRCAADVVLCDLHLPGISGLQVTERLARHVDAPRVIVVSVQQDGPMPRRLLEAGAAGYVGKACPVDELLRAIREAVRGRRYLGADIAQRMALGGGDARSPFGSLSPRELEIAMLLMQGKRMSDIARRLSLSPKTVSTHKYRLFDKLAIADTMALARMAAQYGLGDPALAV